MNTVSSAEHRARHTAHNISVHLQSSPKEGNRLREGWHLLKVTQPVSVEVLLYQVVGFSGETLDSVSGDGVKLRRGAHRKQRAPLVRDRRPGRGALLDG